MPSTEEISQVQPEAAAPHAPPNKGGGLNVDAQALAARLRERIQGDVRFDRASRALYAADASNYRQVPIGVVIPRNKADVIQTVKTCREFNAPILSRGGGTSLAGQCCNVAVVMDMSQYYNQILSIDVEGKRARIQPGLVLDTLRHAAEKHGLTFGPDPATHNHCTLGGMMGNNSCGTHAQMAGKTVDNVISMEILTYDGLIMEVGETSDEELQQIVHEGGRKAQIYSRLKALRDANASEIKARYPKIPRRVSGYNLDSLLPEYNFHVAQALIGSESTLVVILEATVRLVRNPPQRTLVVVGYPSVFESADQVPQILKHNPIALEGIDDKLVENMKKKREHSSGSLLPKGKGWLVIEFGDETKTLSDARASALVADLKLKGSPTVKVYDNPDEEKEVWFIRESGLGATAFIPDEPDTWEGWEDSAVHPDKLGAYLRDLRKLYDRYKFDGALYGHFGQGCVHTRITFDLVTKFGVQKFRSFLEEASDLVVKYGGSFSGEHGDGQSRAELLPKMFGEQIIHAFEEFKNIWDPLNKMNPGKVVFPYRILDNLRLGPDYNPATPSTKFQFPEDKFDFSRSALRCVGIGECRRDSGDTMCPSYRVTREEMHSTRGRAHLFFEMLRGDVIKDGWKSEEVKEALDLCLACKGCKGDCPVNVDMATYKAEFLSHYFKGKLRPRSAYAFGLIYWWARLASFAPRLVNFFTQTPGFAHVAKFLSGMSPQRRIPKFATHTFKSWFHRRQSRPDAVRPTVLLWADTFNNHFHPNVAKAAVEVLQNAGFHVEVPKASLCCGRPLYDYGWVDKAKQLLLRCLEELRPYIRDGVPVIGLEPSCVSVFRDELKNLLPHDKDARRLSEQTFLLSEFLVKHVDGYAPPKLHRKAIVQGHCHHKSVLSFKEEKELMERIGLDAKIPDSSCCGMAGSFGFEEKHYDVSIKCGEEVILPEVRKQSLETLIIADGFSCREQISQTTGREPMHIAEVLQMAIKKETV
jgi:FAD/FMN-containing dehydrogenase/Fe-S oxidoreductase